jgi:hypothetical protein
MRMVRLDTTRTPFCRHTVRVYGEHCPFSIYVQCVCSVNTRTVPIRRTLQLQWIHCTHPSLYNTYCAYATHLTGRVAKLTFLSSKLTFLSSKLTFLSSKLTFLSSKLTFLSSKLTFLSSKLDRSTADTKTGEYYIKTMERCQSKGDIVTAPLPARHIYSWIAAVIQGSTAGIEGACRRRDAPPCEMVTVRAQCESHILQGGLAAV